jgi:CHASE3 domain sensor protein
MKWNVGMKIGAGFSVLLVAFVVVGLVSYRTTNELIETSDLRQQSYEVLRAIDDLDSQIQDDEIGQRNYAITHDDGDREMSTTAQAKAEQDLRRLRSLVENDPAQRPRLERLDALVRERVAFGRDTMNAIVTQGAAAGETMVRTGKAKGLRRQIGEVADEMERDEVGRLERRAAATEESGWVARTSIVAGTAAAIAIAIVAWLLLPRAIARPLTEITSVA